MNETAREGVKTEKEKRREQYNNGMDDEEIEREKKQQIPTI